MAERLVAGAVLFIYTGAVLKTVIVGSDPDNAILTSEQLTALHAVWYPTYLVVAVLALRNFSAVWSALLANWLILLFVSLAIVSSLWSLNPAETFVRGCALGLSTLFGAYLSIRFDLRHLIRLLAWVLGIGMALSLVFGLLLPDIGIMSAPYPGAWQGAYSHKNVLGRYALLNLFALSLIGHSFRRHRWILWCDVGLSIVLLLLSQSKSPLIAGAALLGILCLIRVARRSPRLVVPGLALLVLALGLLFLNADSILLLFGRDLTLTGRVELWSLVWEKIAARWFLGYGFEAFWIAVPGPVEDIWFRLEWRVPHAHNEFLNVMLGLGLVGILVIAALLVKTWRLAWSRLRESIGPEAVWVLGLVGMLFLFGLDEASFLQPISLYWVLLVATIVAADRRWAPGHAGLRAPRSRRPVGHDEGILR